MTATAAIKARPGTCLQVGRRRRRALADGAVGSSCWQVRDPAISIVSMAHPQGPCYALWGEGQMNGVDSLTHVPLAALQWLISLARSASARA